MLALTLPLLLACGPKLPSAPEGDSAQVLLDGALIDVRWDDGDTFSWRDAASGEKVKARLKGFNTLESYGPVHRFGDWTGAELYALAKEAGQVAGSAVWTCTDTGDGGGYGRRLIDCPDLRAYMLSQGPRPQLLGRRRRASRRPQAPGPGHHEGAGHVGEGGAGRAAHLSALCR